MPYNGTGGGCDENKPHHVGSGDNEIPLANAAKQMLLTSFFSAKLFLKLHQAKCVLLYRLAPFSQIFKAIIPYSLEQRQ
jgi:hypothetical protein